MSPEIKQRIEIILICLLFPLLFGCSKTSQEDDESSDLDRIVLQTDWFAQPEQGGFYQAKAKNYYREVGIEVEILSGGPNAMSVQKVIKGRAHFAMNRADTIYNMRARGIPVWMVMATLQHDPQGLILHESNPVNHFKELDGKSVMAVPGLTWIDWIQARYDISLNIIPHDFGMERFLNNSEFIQQCLVTNEPFYAQTHGVDAKVMRLADSGFNPYHGIYCLESFARENPNLVRRFIEASIRGWTDFIEGDPNPAFELIQQRNPKMNREFMEFSRDAMKQLYLVEGYSTKSEAVGKLMPTRLDNMVDTMKAYQVLEVTTEESWYSTEFLPENLQSE